MAHPVHACRDLSLDNQWTTTGFSRLVPVLVCDKFTAAGERFVFAAETTLETADFYSDCLRMDGNFSIKMKYSLVYIL